MGALPFLSVILILACREQVPVGQTAEPPPLNFALPLGTYYSYDNWRLDEDGYRIPSSRFRSSWMVIDTGATLFGYPGVTTAVESTFAPAGRDSLLWVGYRYFRTNPEGDVFEYGFISRLLAQRDSLELRKRWDRLLSPAGGSALPWPVERYDSLGPGEVEGRLAPVQELVGTTVNGRATAVPSYRVDITGRQLSLSLWIAGAPPAFLRLRDASDVRFNRMFVELTLMTVEMTGMPDATPSSGGILCDPFGPLQSTAGGFESQSRQEGESRYWRLPQISYF